RTAFFALSPGARLKSMPVMSLAASTTTMRMSPVRTGSSAQGGGRAGVGLDRRRSGNMRPWTQEYPMQCPADWIFNQAIEQDSHDNRGNQADDHEDKRSRHAVPPACDPVGKA